MREHSIPGTPDGRDKRPAFCPSAVRKETRQRRMMRSSLQSERPSLVTQSVPEDRRDTVDEVVSEYREVESLQATLKNVQRELATDLWDPEFRKQFDAELREVIMECIVVGQDLIRGSLIQDSQTSHQAEMRRYPQRRRTTLMQSYQEVTSPMTKSVRGAENPPVTQAVTNRAKRKTTESLGNSSASQQEDAVVSEEGEEKGEDGCLTQESEKEMGPSLKLPYRIQTTTASLKEVIALFQRAQEECPSMPYAPSLPPFSDEVASETIQPRAMQLHNGWQQEQRESLLEDPSPTTKVYVMPSGYIVQSVQMVLEKKKQEEKSYQRMPSLHPFFLPEPYCCRSSGCYLPLWEPPVEVSCRSMEMDVRAEMIRTAPRTEAFYSGCIPGGIDVRNLLAEMEENEKKYHFFPLPSQQPSSDQLDRDTQELLMQIHQDALLHEHLSGETDETSDEGPLSRASLDLEQRLQDFSRRLEEFCEA